MAANLRRLGLPTIVALVVIAVGTVELFAGALSAGVTVDEPSQDVRTSGWINHGWYVPEPLLVDGHPDPGNELASPFVYGPAFSSIAHLLNVEAGNESIGEVSESVDAYAVRHLTVAALAAIAIAVVGLLVWLLTGAWRVGTWAATGLIAIPSWIGQGFFNIKDIPVATGYTLVTAALVIALIGANRPASKRRRLTIAVLLAGGIFIAAGTRLALWAPFVASLASYALLRLGQQRLGGFGRFWGADRAVLAGAVIGTIAIAVIYPSTVETPKTLLLHSVSNSAGYPNKTVTLTAGQSLSEHPPW